MFYVSELKNTPPERCSTELQKKIYETFAKLNIPYERVDTDPAITMDLCLLIDEKIGIKIVKTLFLCNRQQTEFYLFATRGDKPFVTKDFSRALGISRVSFAPSDKLLSMMGTVVGATTVLSALLDMDAEKKVKIILDKEVTDSEWYGCSDGTVNGYIKVKLKYILEDFFNYTGHKPLIINV